MKIKLIRRLLECYTMLKDIRKAQRIIEDRIDWQMIFSKQYLTIEETALYLGIDEKVVKRMTKGPNPILSYHMATFNYRYIAREDIDRMLKRNHVKSPEDIKEDSYSKFVK